MKRLPIMAVLLVVLSTGAETPKLSDKSLLLLKDDQIQILRVANQVQVLQTQLGQLQARYRFDLQKAEADDKIDLEKFNVDPNSLVVSPKPQPPKEKK